MENIDKTEQITNSLIKQYLDGNHKAEEKFRKKLENMDWDKEFKKHIRDLTIGKISFAIVLFSFIVILIIGFSNNKEINASFAGSVAIAGGCISSSIVFMKTSERYKLFKLLREWMER